MSRQTVQTYYILTENYLCTSDGTLLIVALLLTFNLKLPEVIRTLERRFLCPEVILPFPLSLK